MSRKRDKPYFSPHEVDARHRAPFSKRRRPLPRQQREEDVDDNPAPKKPSPAAVVVMGLSTDCSVLDLKSRFEIYGEISRTRIVDDVGHITYRSKESAEAAIAAALDVSFGISADSKKVQVLWATDPLAQWKEGVGGGNNRGRGSTSKLLRADIPLSRHGRGNKLASAVVNPRSSSSSSSSESGGGGELDVPFKGREIVAYDDIL